MIFHCLSFLVFSIFLPRDKKTVGILDAVAFFWRRTVDTQILKDSEKRKIYDKLGPEAVASKFPVDKIAMLLEVRQIYFDGAQIFVLILWYIDITGHNMILRIWHCNVAIVSRQAPALWIREISSVRVRVEIEVPTDDIFSRVPILSS